MYRIDRNSTEPAEQSEQPEDNPDFCGSNVFSKNLPGVAAEGSELATSPATDGLRKRHARIDEGSTHESANTGVSRACLSILCVCGYLKL